MGCQKVEAVDGTYGSFRMLAIPRLSKLIHRFRSLSELRNLLLKNTIPRVTQNATASGSLDGQFCFTNTIY